jgi:radical SAM protein with 4Fe4S-binding SPASM domain
MAHSLCEEEGMTDGILQKSLMALRALATRRVSIDCDRIPFRFDNVPRRKILNWILVEASVLIKPNRPWGWPTHAQVEPANSCNIGCVLCPVTEGLDRPLRHMELRTFERLIDELGQHLFIILLWDWGEPFLNPSVYDMISYAKTRSIGVISSTNGHVFAKGEHAERLVLSGLDCIVVAVDGVTQQTYEQYRQGGDLDTVTRGITNILKARSALGSITPMVNLRFIVMRHNEHEIPQLEQFARSLGVDALTLRTLCTYDNGGYCVTAADGSAFVPENPAYQPFGFDPVHNSPIRRDVNPCKVLWNNPAIHSDGQVFPCTFDPHGRIPLGDITESRFADIWWGPGYGALRREFRQNYRGLDLCRDCVCSFEGGSMGEERDREAVFFKTDPGDSRRSPVIEHLQSG